MNNLRDYRQDVELIKQFLTQYTELPDDQAKYIPRLQKVANREVVDITIELGDLEKFNNDLAKQVYINCERYTKLFYKALDDILPTCKTRDPESKDTMDIFIERRMQVLANRANNAERGPRARQASQPSLASASNRVNIEIDNQYPPELIRRVEVYFKPASLKATPIREVKAEKLGHLVSIRGIVTRVTDVKPKITVVCYSCDQCSCETFQVVSGNEYMPIFRCTSAPCTANKSQGRLNIHTRGSKFVKFQEIKVQENSEHVPEGHIPRTMTVIAYGELTRKCTPGDHITVSGVFTATDMPIYRMRSGGLAVDTFIETHYLIQMTKSDDGILGDDPMTIEEAKELHADETFSDKLSSSIAPEIWGHTNLKKALLLLLVGGVEASPQGMRIRGNINICLMGDPGVAKSQLLGFIERLAPRSQLTTGRGSSGVGLTAAVLKDPITEEMVLEGGALVLADMGICCIDEFDKMLDGDRTAIHEVMEQQTVSIAKAGINTTLNARVSILAAANPAYGRYNVHKTMTDNLQIPSALLSRFDLLWLIRDKPDGERDLELAEHITMIHANPGGPPPTKFDALDMKTMRRYIALCKTKMPFIPQYLTSKLEDIYVDIRKRHSTNTDKLFTSARSLLAIIRLSTAYARLRLADVVIEEDIDNAVFLYNCSRDSIEGAVVAKPNFAIDFLKMLQRHCCKIQDRRIPWSTVVQIGQSSDLYEEQIANAIDCLEQCGTLDRADDSIFLVDFDFQSEF